MSEEYEIVIFTASLSQYAKPLIKKLDRKGIGFLQLYREHCTFHEGMYFVKDLSKLGRDLKDIIIVDNSPSAYMFQPENAMPILSWYSSKADNELFKLMSVLQRLVSVEDVTKETLNLWNQRQLLGKKSPLPVRSKKMSNTPRAHHLKSSLIGGHKRNHSNVSFYPNLISPETHNFKEVDSEIRLSGILYGLIGPGPARRDSLTTPG